MRSGMKSSARRRTPMKAAADVPLPFAPGDFVVYGSHGVGQVVKFETQRIGGGAVTLVVIAFAADGVVSRMMLRVPAHKAAGAGLRAISTPAAMELALARLAGPPAPAKGVWSRVLAEHTAKINSGDPLAVAEVLRDLFRPLNGKARSPGQQMLYEKALARLGGELAAVDRTDAAAAALKLESLLHAA